MYQINPHSLVNKKEKKKEDFLAEEELTAEGLLDVDDNSLNIHLRSLDDTFPLFYHSSLLSPVFLLPI